MALQSNTQIFIGAIPVNAYKHIMLHQEIDAHHVLELVCRMDVLENIAGDIASKTKDFLGETITVKISSVDVIPTYKELEFKGIITSVNNTKGFFQQNGDLVSIKAHSCSIIADDGPHYNSFYDIGLSEIIDSVFRGYNQSILATSFNPQNPDTIHYSVQHNESAFAYASRLAAQYGEWFYYDGKTLLFGAPDSSDTITLNYGKDLQEFSLKLSPAPNNFKYFTNDYLADEHHEITTENISTGVNGFTSVASEKGTSIFARETKVYVNSYNDPKLKKRLDQQAALQTKATEIKQVQIQGVSDNPGVNLGRIVSIKGKNSEYGNFRIISVSHTATENGKYQNRFTGISADSNVYPNTNVMAYPKSESQVAIVTDNSDPEGIGRIRVQLPWQQETGEMTPWLRMLTPHGGSEKGFHFIPEIKEEVLVGFEGGNAERPYIMGSLYTGGANPSNWNTEKNDIKAIRTRSGHTIELNDATGSEFITVTDKNGNHITIDTTTNHITVAAGETMTFTAKNIKIKAEENIDMVAGNDFTKSVSENYNVMTKNSTLIVEENLSTDSKKQQNISDEISMSSNQQNLTLSSAKTVDVQSKEKVKLF